MGQATDRRPFIAESRMEVSVVKKSLGIAIGVLLLIGALSAPALAGGITAWEPRVGFVNIEGDIGSTFILALTAHGGELSPNLFWEGTIDFWTKGYDITYYEWTWTNIGVIGGLRYEFPTDGGIVPFAFGGLGMHYAKWSWDYTGQTTGFWDDLSNYDDSSTEFGIQVGGGARFSEKFIARAGFDSNGGADYFFGTLGMLF